MWYIPAFIFYYDDDHNGKESMNHIHNAFDTWKVEKKLQFIHWPSVYRYIILYRHVFGE